VGGWLVGVEMYLYECDRLQQQSTAPLLYLVFNGAFVTFVGRMFQCRRSVLTTVQR
jgi:hypothetical protein